MKNKLIAWIAFCSFIFLSGCTSPTTPSFEDKHAEEMAKKEVKEATATGEQITTIELLTPESPAEIEESTVEYASWIQGFYAEPLNNTGASAVILIHEWRGLNDHIKDMARIMAMNGYKALAVDLYEGQVADSMETARTLSSSLNQEAATANLLAAEWFLRTKTEKVASLGRCLGGKQSLELSLASETLDATIIYYGRLYEDPTILSGVNEPLLWIFAENDGWIPPSAVAAFEQWLTAAGKTWFDITIYSWASHAFANPTGNAFEKEATLDAWKKTLEFLEKNIK